jgi:predicted Zn-dependent peptidase
MLITVAGGVKEVEVIRLVNKYFGNFYNSQGSTFKIQTFEDRQANPCVKIKTKETDQAHFILGFLTEGRGYKNRYAQTVLASLLGSGASSRLFTEVREKRGLAYAVGGSLDRYSDVGCFDVYVGSDTAKSYEAISVILDQCYGIAQNEYKVSQKELDKVKGFIKGRTALSLEDSENVNDFFAEQILFDKEIFTPEEVFKKIDKITIDDVNVEAKKLFIPSHLNLAVIGPFKDKGKFVKLLK